MAEGSEREAASEDPARANEEHELEAEEESAAAMDADVPQPPDATQTTEAMASRVDRDGPTLPPEGKS